MKNLTGSKRSTASATAIRKGSRWFRLGTHRDEIEQLFDLYWGGKERRITGLTLRIVGVNFIALLSLLAGVIYLVQYQEKLIQSHLKTFAIESSLISVALMEAVERHGDIESLSKQKVENITSRLGVTLDKRILVFDRSGHLIADTRDILDQNAVYPVLRIRPQQIEGLQSIEILKRAGRFFLSLIPRKSVLPIFPGAISSSISDYPDAQDALSGSLGISVWRDGEDGFVLTAAVPIPHQNSIVGAVMLISEHDDVKKALGEAWFDILKIFAMTLVVTIMLSIYLSGVIARPLKKLASAAENVRKGKLKYTDIPDMRYRNDEIGELSIVLRDMTQALWERMDSIEAFAADVAHEIKNPLTSLKSAVETAAIVKKKEDRDKLLGVIKHDVERLGRLITDISNASRLDAELSREHFEKIDLKQVMQNLLDMYKNPLDRELKSTATRMDTAIKDGVTIKLVLPEDAIFILGSEGRINQVFQNIIANALSFSPVKSTITIKATKKSKRVTISFEDQGPGIPENRLNNVFERFYSERPQHEDYGKHSGLGLSICKQIIAAHNGLIYAENAKDRSGNVKGARFVIILNTL